MNKVPSRVFLTKGVGRHKERLTSFEMALRNADIAQFNIVKVSSIFPPGCKLLSKKEGLRRLKPGQITYCVLSHNASNEPHRLLGCSIGLAIPKNPKNYGYLSEHHSFGQKQITVGEYAEDLAASMLATILNVKFDPDRSWDEKKEQWKISGQIVHTRNVTQSAVGDKNGVWTTVLAAAVFCE